MAKIYSKTKRPAYSGPSRAERKEQIYRGQTYQSPTSKRRTTPSQPRKTSVSIYGGTLPGSPAWQAEQGAGKSGRSVNKFAGQQDSPYRFYNVSNLPGFTPPSSSYAGSRSRTFSAGGGAIGTLPGSPAWQAQQGGGRYTQAGTPSPEGAGAPAALQPPYAPQQQPAYAPQQQTGFDYSKITGMFEESMAEANRANEARYQQGLGIYGQIADIYAPGGGFGAGHEAQLERTKTRDVASAQQQMVSSGLWGTTVAAAIPAAWEETVGQPSRLALQDVQMGRYGEALAGKAGFMERRSDIGPDMGLFAGLMQGAYAGPMGQQAGGGQVGGGQVGSQRYGTPPAGGGSVPSSQRPNMGRYGTPQSGAAPVPAQSTITRKGGGGGGSKGPLGGLSQAEYKKRQLKYGGRSMAGSTPQSSIYGNVASRPGWGKYS